MTDEGDSVSKSMENAAAVRRNQSQKNPKCIHGITRAMCKRCKCSHKDGTQYWATCLVCGPKVCVHGLSVRCKICWLCEHRKWNSNCAICCDFASFQEKTNYQVSQGSWADYFARNPKAWEEMQAAVKVAMKRQKCTAREESMM